MNTSKNIRKADRKKATSFCPAIVSFQETENQAYQFVRVINFSIQGVLVSSDMPLDIECRIHLLIKGPELKQWNKFCCRIAWNKPAEDGQPNYVGLEYLPQTDMVDEEERNQFPLSPEDIDFILSTRLVKILPNDGICSFLNCLVYRRLDSGVQFITYGQKEDSLYIIQKGLCSIQVKKQDKTIQTVAQRRERDIIGEIALLTGEPRTASVISESKMILWELKRDKFDTVCESYPDVRVFLTELLTNRLENSYVIGVRNIGRYMMTHRIGHGGWSFVYKGRHKTLHMPVAIKMMKHNQAMDPDFIENFRQEGKIIARLSHPNIVQIYDIEEKYRTIFIIMEYLDGESLDALLDRKGALPFARALNFLRQICSGLAYAHDQEIVHRDIKPANILIMDNDRIKLLDFGLACTPGEEDFGQTGTVQYMSPEQIEGDPVDRRSDIYSLGIMAYEMFTGEKPFPDDDIQALMKLHVNKDIPDPSILVPDLPDTITQFILKSCAKSPDERYHTLHDVIEVLSAAAETLKEEISRKPADPMEVTIVLIAHNASQGPVLNKLLDEFSSRSEDLGFALTVACNTRIK